MSSEELVATMLNARQQLRRLSPAVLDWSKQQWSAWLDQARRPDFGGRRARQFAVAALTTLDDLPSHLGLMQLVADTDLKCTVMLTLPTAESAALAKQQARRQGWELLVQFATEAECEAMLRQLNGDERLAIFPWPAPLGADGVFNGTAADLETWRASAAAAEVDGPGIVQRLVVANVEQLAPPPRVDDNENGSEGDVAEAQAELVPDIQGTLSLPIYGPAGELTVTSTPLNDVPKVLVRQSAIVRESAGALKIRMAGSFLGEEPRPIEIEGRMNDAVIARSKSLLYYPPSQLQPWMLSAFLNRGGAGNAVMRAFAAGVGCRIAYAEDEPGSLSDIPAVWGVLRDSDRILSQAKAQGLYFFYVDHAYFNRGHGRTYRITRNAYEAGPVRKCPGDRLAGLDVHLTPWRRSGREIIVCPPTDYFMNAHNCHDWLETTLAALERHTDRPVIVREKPKAGEEGVRLATALETAHALVAHSSNVAVEAVCLGTPVFVSPASAAAPVGQTDLQLIETPIYRDREPWLAHLAYNQFSLEEIANGEAWRLLIEQEDRELA